MKGKNLSFPTDLMTKEPAPIQLTDAPFLCPIDATAPMKNFGINAMMCLLNRSLRNFLRQYFNT